MAADTSVPSNPPSIARPPLPNPRRTGTFGMLLFLASLLMLFGATIIGYVVIRLQQTNPDSPHHLPLGQIELSPMLWLSTFIIVFSSIALHYAGTSVALERQRAFRNAMLATLIAGFAFLVVQVPAMWSLAQTQKELSASSDSRLYLLVIVLIVVHGLHVVGGLIPLTVMTRKAFRGAYDHERYHPVVHMAMYWHFLDIIWIIMFTVMMLMR